MVNNESPPQQTSDPPPIFLESVVSKFDETFAVMNRGVCLFILIRVPQWIWAQCPFALKCTVAALRLGTWLIIVFLSAAPTATCRTSYPTFLPTSVRHFYVYHSIAINIALWSWTILALSGSIWGMLYLKSGPGLCERWKQFSHKSA